jgi:putative phosphoribosyl transferase
MAQREARELTRLDAWYRGERPLPKITGRTIVLVDDRLADPRRMLAVIEALRAYHPARLVVGVPIGTSQACREIAARVDHLVCAVTEVGPSRDSSGYREPPVSDKDIRRLLQVAEDNERRAEATDPPGQAH